ncbi:hypothetical protein PCASD_25482 [Puccinia coronata f. sp. avenae]|uniref:Uncharacterized protein n=1 Tax=Puccinia coronata f. sp. avenae TaxID=200324 RepID=A0A2N5TWI6_9BASI|nr:hypothetical protein PCASD_25482 [Puccinia coronata f. sp. avenae]
MASVEGSEWNSGRGSVEYWEWNSGGEDLVSPPSTASINWSNTPVRAVLDPPCSTSDRTGVSDRLGKASVGHAGPITGQTRRFDRCSTRPVRPVNAGRVPALTGQTRPFEHRSNRRVRPVIGPACPTGSEEHRSNPAKPITGQT